LNRMARQAIQAYAVQCLVFLFMRPL
jgi:hypothetical protein